MAIRAVLFDLYDTLGYSISTSAKAETANLLSEIGVDPALWQKCWKSTTPAAIRGEFRLVERVALALERAQVTNVNPGFITRLAGLILSDSVFHIYSDTCDCLIELHKQGFKLGLVSNVSTTRSHLIFELELDSYFDVLALSCELGASKPGPELYCYALQQLGLKAEECVYVGDGCSHELSAAKALNMTVVRIDREVRDEDVRETACDYQVLNLHELLDWLEQGIS